MVHSATSSVLLPFSCDGCSREKCECALRRKKFLVPTAVSSRLTQVPQVLLLSSRWVQFAVALGSAVRFWYAKFLEARDSQPASPSTVMQFYLSDVGWCSKTSVEMHLTEEHMLFLFTTFVDIDWRVLNNRHDRIRARKNGRTVDQKKGIPDLVT